MTEGDFVVIGTERNSGGAPFALLARKDDQGLTYAGSAFVTLPASARDLFWMLSGELATAQPAIAGVKSRKATWCRPELMVRVRHLRGGGMVRHGALIGVSA